MFKSIDNFILEDGQKLPKVQISYKTWGTLNKNRDNVILVCHTLTGDQHVDIWWKNLVGKNRAFDINKYYVIAANVLGSCYGTLGPTSINPITGKIYGIQFPIVSIRDTVNLHRQLMEKLNIQAIEVVVGGSMGGMLALEWAFQGDFVHKIIPIASGGKNSAWSIGINQLQRQAICSDPEWKSGNYSLENQPITGLAMARKIAMVSYRTPYSFNNKFGREKENGALSRFLIENYLDYQGLKFVKRFDANSYIRLTQKLDSHDISRGRGEYIKVLKSISQKVLVIGIDSDVLYPLHEQYELSETIPKATIEILSSPHGHDAFLIDTIQLNMIIKRWLN